MKKGEVRKIKGLPHCPAEIIFPRFPPSSAGRTGCKLFGFRGNACSHSNSLEIPRVVASIFEDSSKKDHSEIPCISRTALNSNIGCLISKTQMASKKQVRGPILMFWRSSIAGNTTQNPPRRRFVPATEIFYSSNAPSARHARCLIVCGPEECSGCRIGPHSLSPSLVAGPQNISLGNLVFKTALLRRRNVHRRDTLIARQP